ncbi:Oidioi.mRNA.OKI2018_I69.PAR.g11544.t1.cds [Oikopleura dioica]|uniref:Oidioi.mRNA.OKI2018_I69.PAR.g11544.t1.cds n=1 Tax=Oikopleura dioica TaxID=34765 RepID=A0ABN7S1Y7_OIKDI|nr:Oidioi.mRNA.OKI2018_I69.PAR.g11544.t1.cds [Oikopleura dioica]
MDSQNYLKTADIFKCNVDQCNHTSRIAGAARDRPRCNDPKMEFPNPSTLQNFKCFVKSYAGTCEDQANNLKIIGNLLKEDRYFENNDQRKQEQVNIIQNMFDGFKYSAPLLKNIFSLSIPINVDHDYPLP